MAAAAWLSAPATTPPPDVIWLAAWSAAAGIAEPTEISLELSRWDNARPRRFSRSNSASPSFFCRRRRRSTSEPIPCPSRRPAGELARAYSGHSLRAGYVTSAAMKNVPERKIRRGSRHSSVAMLARYIRDAEEWSESGLKGVGF